MTAALLEARELRKRFGALVVTDGVSLAVAAGARHALIGPNGAGKTTLVGMLSGTLQPDSGTISLGGLDSTQDGPEQRVAKGLVRTFQVTNLFRGLTLFDNVFLAASARCGASANVFERAIARRDVIQETQTIIIQLGLQDDAHRIVSEIAYGRQRLIELAIALTMQPKILLLDEPAAGIPGSDLHYLLDAIERLPGEMAVVMIEHDMQIVRRFAKTVSVLVNGKILMTGSPDAVMSSSEVRRVYLGQSGATRFAGTSFNA